MKPNAAPNNQAGSMVLEAMIAILIFSIGILGLVAMQASAVSTVADAKYRADAAFFADQIIGQMWAGRLTQVNASGVTYYVPDNTFTWPSPGANATVTAWAGASGVAGALPGASAAVAVNGQQVTVSVQWTPPNAATHTHTSVAYID
jgi:type IV pilus assembly protein PilV